MTTDSPAAWALWFLMLGLYSIVLFIGTVTSVYVTYLLRGGKPSVTFRFTENGQDTMVYVYNDEHWLVRAFSDELVRRKPKMEDLEAQNGQPGVLTEDKSSLIPARLLA